MVGASTRPADRQSCLPENPRRKIPCDQRGYAREHWTHPHENPPVGLILCSERDTAVAHYALGNLTNQVLAREYQLNLPTEAEIAARVDAARRSLSTAPARLEPPADE